MPILTKVQFCELVGIELAAVRSNIESQLAFGEKKYLLPIIGNDLLAAISCNSVSEPYLSLLGYCKDALAWLVWHDYIPTVSVNISGAGISTAYSDKSRAASEARITALQSQAREMGYNFLDTLIGFLKTSPDFTDWQTSDLGISLSNCFVSDLKIFENYYSLAGSFLSFYSLRSLIKRMERNHIIPFLSESLYNTLVSFSYTPFGESENEIQVRWVIEMMKEATVLYTVAEATVELPINIKAEGLFIYPFTDMLGSNQRTSASTAQLLELRNKLTNHANSILAKAKKYIIANPTEFTGFPFPAVSETYSPINNPVVGIIGL